MVLSAAALVPAPAVASDGGTAEGAPPSSQVDNPVVAKKDPVLAIKDCEGASTAKIRVTVMSNGELEVVGVVWSSDEDVWAWKFKHNGDFSYMGEVKAKDADRSLRVVRFMADLAGTDEVFFRAENTSTGEVCKLTKNV
ncbi:hypothetical protein QWY28_19410 [Nocardioides sp. SOB77]|uniref:Uncharacterized protein n=1 Tax=Nocardioides oceani TaxID=3058369 RepID=A0ABT8FL82_9ACTN|nr:hypothetical protein [Nocardioides oceani]MDN4175142.1 hypothetical protein [Nocardioides oceani]